MDKKITYKNFFSLLPKKAIIIFGIYDFFRNQGELKMLHTKKGVLIIDGIVSSRKTYKSLTRKQIDTALEKFNINKVTEKIYVNQFGVPLVIHRIIGDDVYRFAKIVGVSPITPEQTKQVETMLSLCKFDFAGENIIFEKVEI
jgi:hypothetical protein